MVAFSAGFVKCLSSFVGEIQFAIAVSLETSLQTVYNLKYHKTIYRLNVLINFGAVS